MGNEKVDLELKWNELDNDTVLVEGIVKGKASKKSKNKIRNRLSTVELHLFDEEFIGKMREIEVEINQSSQKEKIKASDLFSKIYKYLLQESRTL